MAVVAVQCPECESHEVVRYGRQANGEPRYRCHNVGCERRIFFVRYHTDRAVTGGEAAEGRHGAEWQRYPRYCSRAEREPNDSEEVVFSNC